MKRTLFTPDIDGLRFPVPRSLSSAPADAIQKLHLEALPKLLDYMTEHYPGSNELYNVTRWLEKWIMENNPKTYGLQGGSIYTILDYFFFKQRPPKRLPADQSPFEKHLQKRNSDNLSLNVLYYLKAIVSTKLLPDEWTIRALLLLNVRKTVAGLGEYFNTSVCLDLRMPPTGAEWLQQITSTAWRTIKTSIDRRKPIIVVLVTDIMRIYHIKEVIAFAYDDSGSSTGLYYYDPDFPGQTKTLVFDSALKIGSASPDARFGDIKGFYTQAYTPERPPRSALHRLCYFMFLAQLFWLLRRIFTLVLRRKP